MAEKAGYEVLGHFPLEPEGWWEEFYVPLKKRMAQLRSRAEENPDLAEVIEDMRVEMDMYERFGHVYGYTFFLMRKKD